MRTIHRLSSKRFAKASIKGRITCEKLNVVLANEGRKLKRVEGRVVEGKRRVFVFAAVEEL
jgi:isocitrate dehydrogenase